MIWAFLNDLAQRLITFNKLEQRHHLLRRLLALVLPAGSKALDFGCGTALFVPTFRRAGLRYVGYDIDERLLGYARRVRRGCVFASTYRELEQLGPFDVIVANCCFHHIADEDLAAELQRLKTLLADGGSFLMIDLLLGDRWSFLRRQLGRLERGAYLRRAEEYQRLVEKHFTVRRVEHDRSYFLSCTYSPLYGDLVVLECGK